MRCVQSRRFGYIFNPWSDGIKEFRNESQQGRTYKAMAKAAEDDEAIAARVQLFRFRVPEELYDFENDPDGLHNLIANPEYQSEIRKMRALLRKEMKRTDDPALTAFDQRDDQTALDQFMKAQRIRAKK